MRAGEHNFHSNYEPGGPGSGVGSTATFTEPMREFIAQFLNTHDIGSIVDYGCGDWQWAQLVPWSGRMYYGYDIVPGLVERLRRDFGTSERIFRLLDGSDLPRADLYICKDVCIHLPNEDILELISTFSRKARHVLWINTFAPTSWLPAVNAQIRRGACRPVDMGRLPFHVPGEHVFHFGDNGDGGQKSVFHQQVKT